MMLEHSLNIGDVLQHATATYVTQALHLKQLQMANMTIPHCPCLSHTEELTQLQFGVQRKLVLDHTFETFKECHA